MAESLVYPVTRRDETVVDDYHGTKVADPYRWLEDPDSKETQEFVEAQNKVTNSVLESCPNRDDTFARVKSMQNFPKFGDISHFGKKFYYKYNSGLQNQYILYVKDTLEGEARVFLDPNKLSEDGTTSLGTYAFSQSGRYFAYALHRSGSDWQVIHVKDTVTGEDLKDTLDWVKFSNIAWSFDEKGVYYCRYAAPEVFASGEDKEFKRGTETQSAKDQKVYYHVLGTPQAEDQLIFSTPDQPEWMFGAGVTEDGRYLCMYVSESCAPANRFYVLDLTKEVKSDQNGLVFSRILDKFDAKYDLLANDGHMFYFITNKDAPKKKLIKLDINDIDKPWETIIPEKEHVLETALCVNDQFVVMYLEDVKDILYLYSMTGERLKTFEFPAAGSVGLGSSLREDTGFSFSFTSFLYPGTVYWYDLKEGKQIIFGDSKIEGFDPSLFQTEQIFSTSKDGVKIPSFIVRPKTVELNGKNPCLLYGYGGFNISLLPYFSPSRIVWMQNFNGIMVVANLRGGEEYGEAWHEGGIKKNKQNVFNDFIATAENLVNLKYTNPKQLAIVGGSNGGLLVCACVNQRPDLFGCGVSQVGVLDMLRFHKFTIGHAWVSDYGCADNAEDFEYIYKYSPLHTVKKGKEFPALLLTTGDHDDRVVPAHSFKYIAEVQHQLGKEEYQKNPLVVRIEVKAGHGHGKPMDKIIAESADTYAFIAKYTGAQWRN
jgi:prolyl oligopeptidase